MEETVDATASATDADFAREIHDAAEHEQFPRDRATRFYDRIRNTIQRYIDSKGTVVGKTASFLLLVPDVFILLWRLTSDSRVNGKDKVLLGSAVAYFVMPFDLMPEALLGPVGYLDDLIFGVYVLNKVLSSGDASIVREHWSGSDDVLDAIQSVLNAADSLVGKETAGKIRKMMGKS